MCLLILGFVGLGAWNLASHRHLVRTCVRVAGITIAPSVGRDADDGAVYTTRARFLVDGEPFEIEGRSSNCERCNRAGRPVSIYYPPGKPAKGRIVPWSEPLIWGGLPLALALWSVVVLLFESPRPH